MQNGIVQGLLEKTKTSKQIQKLIKISCDLYLLGFWNDVKKHSYADYGGMVALELPIVKGF